MATLADLLADSEQEMALEESATYRGRHLDAGEAEEARRLIAESPDRTRFHVLMALQRDWPDAYAQVAPEVRARILAAALAHVHWLNDFGHLEPGGSWDGAAARALVETGGAARGPLSGLLDDTRPAPLRGSEAATMSSLYGYRRCDFAYRYLSLVLGDDPVFETDLAKRDDLIAALRARSGQPRGA